MNIIFALAMDLQNRPKLMKNTPLKRHIYFLKRIKARAIMLIPVTITPQNKI